MKYVKKRGTSKAQRGKEQDPLQGVANLFDIALVFIVALLLTLMATYQILDFFNPESEITIMKKMNGQWKIIIKKKGKEIKVTRITERKIGGEEGIRLGTAYRLKDGRVIYIPEEESDENK